MRLSTTFFFILIVFFGNAQPIVPYPNHYQRETGTLSLPEKITVSSPDNDFAALIPVIAETAAKYYDLTIEAQPDDAFIRLERNKDISQKEAYQLTINPNGIKIEAGFENGCFYGLQSLLQLINSRKQQGNLECAGIKDTPRYEWRGIMLDESRHFFGTREVKQILDMMALHKMNRFHWHLTDVPGWRIEIKKYPLLTTVGGVGNHTNKNAPAHYYTQEEISEIVDYARERFIQVIPEIDMPGHATAAVKAYPEVSGGGSEKYPDFTFNPGKQATYTFLTNILKETDQMFPSQYIHIGGDEVHFGNAQWATNEEVRQLMKNHGLSNLTEVEHYFINRMADSIQKLNNTVIGWDEVIAAGLSNKNTVVMWWRHDKPQLLKEALDKNFQVIMCPRIPLYFDFVQQVDHQYGRKWGGRFAPIEHIYQFPDEQFTGKVALDNKLIKGIQGNVWTERIHTPERLQFMLYPRLSALAEAGWTNDSKKSPASFFARMNRMLALYEKEGIHYYDYRNPDSSPEIHGPAQ